jgi:hypothetical protein
MPANLPLQTVTCLLVFRTSGKSPSTAAQPTAWAAGADPALYPRAMASGSTTPPAEEPPEPGSRDPDGGRPGAAPGEEERYGPLRVRRTRKDDGRALILYSDARRGHGGIDDDAGERVEPDA